VLILLSVLLRIGLIIISWSTFFLIPKKVFKMYTPVATFASLLVIIQSILSVPFKWWTVKGGLFTKVFNDLSFIFGPFFIGTIWIFHFTFGKFGLYALINILMDAFLAYPVNWVFEKLKVYKLVNFKPRHIFFTSISYALVIYAYQIFRATSKSLFTFRKGYKRKILFIFK
jgi:hypothetical protein